MKSLHKCPKYKKKFSVKKKNISHNKKAHKIDKKANLKNNKSHLKKRIFLLRQIRKFELHIDKSLEKKFFSNLKQIRNNGITIEMDTNKNLKGIDNINHKPNSNNNIEKDNGNNIKNINNNNISNSNNDHQPLSGSTIMNNVFNKGSNIYYRINQLPLNMNYRNNSNNGAYSPINYMNNISPLSTNHRSQPNSNSTNPSLMNKMYTIQKTDRFSLTKDMNSPFKPFSNGFLSNYSNINLASLFRDSPTLMSYQNNQSPSMTPRNIHSPIFDSPNRNSPINNSSSITSPFYSPITRYYDSPRISPITRWPRYSLNFSEILYGRLNLSKGLEENILNDLPETKINDVSKLTSENKKCIICLDEFMKDDYLTCLPCIHSFHSKCIKNWLKNSKECPICKFKITNETLNYQ